MSLNPRIHNWQGRVVWLIGASTGIGEATARALHAQGAKVVVSARSADTLQRFTEAHPGSVAMALDVRQPQVEVLGQVPQHGLVSAAAKAIAMHEVNQGLARGGRVPAS